jgi:uncharacterized Zn finger protein
MRSASANLGARIHRGREYWRRGWSVRGPDGTDHRDIEWGVVQCQASGNEVEDQSPLIVAPVRLR